MTNNKENSRVELSDAAFRELRDGEVYVPIMKSDRHYPEVTVWSVCWGIAMAILFSAATAFLGLKVGQVFEAAIPIAIIAVGLSGAAKRKNPLGENVIIQSIGACSGMIVAGAIFTLPALYILESKYPDVSVGFLQVFVSSLLGGVLGIFFLIPFRKYFVSDMHGKYPFPEATATTQVLVSGQQGGGHAKTLLKAGLIGGLYDFIVGTFGWWSDTFTTRFCHWGELLADKAKLVFKLNTGAALLGLGYIIGLKYAFIISLGSAVVWWLIVPLISVIWGGNVLDMWNPDIVSVVSSMSPEEIYNNYAKSIGIGGIAMAGIIGIIKSWGIIKSAVGLAAREFGGKSPAEAAVPRTQRDLPMKIILIGSDILVPAFRRHGGQSLTFCCRSGTDSSDSIPVYYRRGQCDCYRGQQSCVGHDTDDIDIGICRDGRSRAAGHRWHGGITYNGRRRLYGPVDGRRFCHRPQDRLLARLYSQEAGDLEVCRHPCVGRHGCGCNDYAQ